MGISASTPLSRERTVDVDATTAAATTAADLDRRVHCVSTDLQCSESSEATSSAAEMSDDDDSNSSSQRQGRDRRDAERESVSVSANDGAADAADAAAAATVATVDDAAEVSDRIERRTSSTTKNTADKSLSEFREELRIKREQRRTAIADLKNEVLQLRDDLAAERLINQQLRANGDGTAAAEADDHSDADDDDGADRTSSDDVDDADTAASASSPERRKRSVETVLRMQLANVNHQLQLANGDVLSLQAELAMTRKQVGTLKEVIGVSKEMVNIREAQLEQLKTKLKEIEDSLAEREMTIMSDTLRKEYDRQLANIRSLRTLYEERARVSAADKENLMRQLETKRTELETEVEKSQGLEARVATLESELQDSVTNLTNVKDDLIDCKSEKKGLEEETAVINQLFSQLLSGFAGGNDLNIDKLAAMLEDNRDLLSDITSSETCKNRAAAMPKLLLDLVSQIEEKSESDDVIPTETITENQEETTANPNNDSTSKKVEILNNLPKVWKVLMELLNHQQVETVPFNENGESEDCYKLVQSPTGPQHVLSVSKTYIRLKDLIVEKKFLQKETHKLKNLNSHLETRLDQKERRLATVTVELNKTWTLVGRMQRQHRQLHTNEQVLRYQLSQKRRMLNELKEELEYCRRKWTLAREKNDESQTQWDTLRREFTARKLQDAGSQMSAESGYSDDPVSDDEPMPEAISAVSDAVVSSVGVLDDLKEVFVPVVVEMPVIVQVHQEAGTSTGTTTGKDDKPLKLSRELRKKKPKAPKTTGAAAAAGAESLEEMFYRISGLDQPEPEELVESDESSDDSDFDADDDVFIDENPTHPNDELNGKHDICDLISTPEQDAAETVAETTANDQPLPDIVDLEDEERHQRRAIRFDRLEEQCQQLIQQVMRTSSRGDDLNKQLDQVQNRYKTPTREAAPEPTATTSSEPVVPTASTSAATPADDAPGCLTAKEQEYTSRRAARLQRLEEECKTFLNRVSVSNSRATALNNHATSLHEYHSTRLANTGDRNEDVVIGEVAVDEAGGQTADVAEEIATNAIIDETPVDAVENETIELETGSIELAQLPTIETLQPVSITADTSGSEAAADDVMPQSSEHGQ